MEELLYNFDISIENVEKKQNISISIVKALQSLEKECQYSKLLEYHMQIIDQCDDEISNIMSKKKLHEQFYDDWLIYQSQQL